MNTCSVCHGKTTRKYITYTQWYRGELVAVENVPAEVCENCYRIQLTLMKCVKAELKVEIVNFKKRLGKWMFLFWVAQFTSMVLPSIIIVNPNYLSFSKI